MLLDAATLSRLAGLKLRARAVVEGVLSGLHKSPHQGQSVEFAEHKEYAPGDELRHLDWSSASDRARGIQHGASTPGNQAGTFQHVFEGVRVITNEAGGVITVIPR